MKSWLPLTLLAASLDPGTHRLEERTSEGVRRYTLVLPERIPAEGAPLVLSLHYAGEVTPWYGSALVEQLVEPGLSGLGAVIVAPDCPGQGWTDPVSREWVITLLDAVEAHLPVNPHKRTMVGYSMGAIGSWHYSGVLAERFGAFVPIAGAARPADLEAAALPAFLIHGTGDQIFPLPDLEDTARAHLARFPTSELHVGQGLGHYQIARYRRLLEGAVPWLEARWAEAAAGTAAAGTKEAAGTSREAAAAHSAE